jgi:RNAse (barnase) inhibitor barstar/pimeloyl-ACP methyl ester carboxylesterase
MLAQQYARKYGKNLENNANRLGKLVLIAPLSREQIQSTKDAAQLAHTTRQKHRKVLEDIYDSRFSKENDYRAVIVKETERVLYDVERYFGGLQFVIDTFDQLRVGHKQDLLKLHNLDYSKALFKALRYLRFVGSLGDDKLVSEQDPTVLLIAREMACKMEAPPTWEPEIEIEKAMNGIREAVKKTISYCETLHSVNRLTLDLPAGGTDIDLSRDSDKLWDVLSDKQRLALRELYANELRELNAYQTRIADEVDKLLDQVRREFGGLTYLIKNYEILSKPRPAQPKSKLQAAGLDYPLEFFTALNRLFYIREMNQNSDDAIKEKRFIGAIVARGFATQFPDLAEILDAAEISHSEAVALIDEKTRKQGPPPWSEENKILQLKNIKEIYANGFDDLSDYREKILEETERILNHVVNDFDGCVECLIKNHPQLSTELTAYGLKDYPPQLYQGLQSLIYVNESPEGDRGRALPMLPVLRRLFGINGPSPEREAMVRKQQYIGALIGRSIACGLAAKIENLQEFPKRMPALNEKAFSFCDAVEKFASRDNDSSQRVYNVVSTYDGINIGFLENWLGLTGEQLDIKKALRESAGSVHNERCGREWSWLRCREEVNQEIENVGIAISDLPKVWKPSDYMHWVPTLILDGTADPVTAGDQSEDLFSRALGGSRILIKFPGLGHQMNLPDIETTGHPLEEKGPCAGAPQFIDGKIKFYHRNVRNCIVDLFLLDKLDKEARVLTEADKIFEKILKENIKVHEGPQKPYEKANFRLESIF